MKKLFIINSLSNGGAERVVSELAEYIAHDNQVFVIVLFKANNNKYQIDNATIISLFEKQHKGIKKYLFLPYIVKLLDKEIENILEDEDNFVITAHLPFPHIVSKFSKFSTNIYRVIHTVYSKKIAIKLKSKLFLKYLYNNTDIITVSKGVEEELLHLFNIKPKSIQTIYNPLEVEKIFNLAISSCDTDRSYLIAVGRLTKIKRFDYLIEFYHKYKLYNDNNLYILGVGDEYNSLQVKIKELKMERYIKLLGWQDNPYKWIKNAKLLILTSDHEAFPMVLLESLILNTPVVSVDCNYGPREILTGELSNFLVPIGNDELLYEKIKLALNNYPNIRKEYTYPYYIEVIANKYLALGEQK